jgi:hypothetical protein
MVGDTNIQNNDVKCFLTAQNVSGRNVKEHLILVFGSYSEASKAAGISESRLHQIFMGYKVPVMPDQIKRLSSAWNIDLVVLTQVLEKLNRGILE